MSDRDLLRHTVATLAYRAQKVLHDVPAGFADHRQSPTSRTPLEILGHLGDLVEWGNRMANGDYKWIAVPAADWQSGCDRFFGALATFDTSIAASTFEKFSPGVIFQGPIADSLTHVGQIAMLRGIVGGPIKPESYARAEIQIGRVGTDQSATRKEFEGDASRKR